MDSKPGYTSIVQTEEVQLFASAPDNQHRRYETKADIKSTVTDSVNSPTTTLRGGMVMGLKDTDGMCYKYSPTATDGTQKPVAVLPKHLSMLDRFGTAEDKMSKLVLGGIFKNALVDLTNVDKVALAVLLRRGFVMNDLDPHGSMFLQHPKARYFKITDYTVLDSDHGNLLVGATAAVNFTLPTLATVGPGFTVWLFQSGDNNMVVTAAADTILYDDTGGGKATTLTWSTANQKIGAAVMMRADYDVAGTLSWYPMQVQRTVVAA